VAAGQSCSRPGLAIMSGAATRAAGENFYAAMVAVLEASI
jgi:hypothetical protein